MNAIELLTRQHAATAELFARLAGAPERERDEIRADLADVLAIHMEIEEQIFYPATNRARTEDLLLEAMAEHGAVKRAMAELLGTSTGDDAFPNRVAVCRELCLHHQSEVERELFPAVTRILDAAALDELGARMERLAAALESPREPIPGDRPGDDRDAGTRSRRDRIRAGERLRRAPTAPTRRRLGRA